ncbi:MAG: sugar phosphate isomerase/epimerase family protein [Verrucomicrobiota bacterium]
MNPVTRRDFLGALALGALAQPAFAANKRGFKKGYMLATFPGENSLSTQEKFQLLKDAGFAGVEPRSHMDQEEVLRACEATGLAVPSVACGPHSRLLANPSPATRAKGVEGIQQALRDAKRYGAPSILVVPGGVSAQTSYADNYKWTQEGIRQCIPLAEELGVAMSIENVWNNFQLSPLEAARYIDEFQSKAVKYHFDIGNVMWMGWPEQWIRILGRRIQTVHLKEFSRAKMNEQGKRKGFDVEYLEGDNDWPAIMKALDETGYRGWGIAEPAYRPAKVEPAARLREISQRMDKIFNL